MQESLSNTFTMKQESPRGVPQCWNYPQLPEHAMIYTDQSEENFAICGYVACYNVTYRHIYGCERGVGSMVTGESQDLPC